MTRNNPLVDKEDEQYPKMPRAESNKYPRFSIAAFQRIWGQPELRAYDVARHFGLSHDGAVRKAKALGLKPKPTGKRPIIDRETFSPMWIAGVMSGEIGRHYGVSASAASHAARRFGLPPRAHGSYGEMTLAQYRDTILASAMARDAAMEQRQILLAEMADKIGAKWVGAEKARAA